jgi:hypothetical protein
MQKSIKQQYIDLQEGKMSQQNFMRNLRMTMPQYITNVTSYKDSVRILKNKGILSENTGHSTMDNPSQSGKSLIDMIELLYDGEYDGNVEELTKLLHLIKTSNNPDKQEILRVIDSKLKGQENNFDASVNETTGENNELLNIILKYVKDPSEAEKYADADPETWPEELISNLNRDKEYTDYFTKQDMADQGMVSEDGSKLNEAKDEKGKWTNASGKELYAQFREIDNLNGQEVLVGIDYEIEKNCKLSKLEAAKIVVKNLKKNPIYYTATLMSGKEGYEIGYVGGKSANAEARRMQFLDKNLGNVVDKKMGMQPVKDVEKVKKDAGAKKETNDTIKGVSLMSLVAQTVRGMGKMKPTGEKMKKIMMKEGMEGEYTFNDSFRGSQFAKLKVMIPDAEIDVEEDPGQTIKTTVSSKQYNDKSIEHAVKSVLGTLEPIKDKKDLGSSFGKFKDQLKEMIRQEIAGAYGGDKMDPEDGSSYLKNEQ